jgi:hypothetical protein
MKYINIIYLTALTINIAESLQRGHSGESKIDQDSLLNSPYNP